MLAAEPLGISLNLLYPRSMEKTESRTKIFRDHYKKTKLNKNVSI